jgi:hypothetical protein
VFGENNFKDADENSISRGLADKARDGLGEYRNVGVLKADWEQLLAVNTLVVAI